ncbi:hypothetical protein V6N11_018533 [Hibiscus sabdariffa]|uniref:Uncharacterized protein n=1 Tax=Hibiscus sabdariffa TaxID=183260 RepID=A0ABR2T8I5_9ROSI
MIYLLNGGDRRWRLRTPATIVTDGWFGFIGDERGGRSATSSSTVDDDGRPEDRCGEAQRWSTAAVGSAAANGS